MNRDGMSSDPKDRRRHRRAPIRIEATLEARRPEDSVRLTVLDLSAGGFLCSISRPMAAMTRLGVRFVFPPYANQPAREMDVMALVIRCEKPPRAGEDHRLAVCFLDLRDDDRDHIEGYVDWYETVHNAPEEADGKELAS